MYTCCYGIIHFPVPGVLGELTLLPYSDLVTNCHTFLTTSSIPNLAYMFTETRGNNYTILGDRFRLEGYDLGVHPNSIDSGITSRMVSKQSSYVGCW